MFLLEPNKNRLRKKSELMVRYVPFQKIAYKPQKKNKNDYRFIAF
jgi:hypothetical protein